MIKNTEGVGGKSKKIVSGQNVQKQTTAERLAKQHEVSAQIIKRDCQLAAAAEKVKPFVTDINNLVFWCFFLFDAADSFLILHVNLVDRLFPFNDSLFLHQGSLGLNGMD